MAQNAASAAGVSAQNDSWKPSSASENSLPPFGQLVFDDVSHVL